MNAAAVRENWEGQIVDGKFRLLQWLGGTQGTAVFRTEVPGQLGRKAAIKIIPADSASAQRQLDRWERAASLSHRHLLQIFAYGRCQINGSQRFYIVMELAEEDLSQVLPQRPLTLQETDAMLAPVMDALTYIHQSRLVHGHIKPSNIMATADELKLSSDSLHPMGESNPRPTQLSAYDAPEAENGAVTPFADVWSLGATLVAVFTQHPPIWKRSQPVEPRVPDSIVEPYHSVARGCLRLDPNDRITLEQIKSTLQPGRPTVNPVLTQSKQDSRPSRMLPRMPVLIFVILLLVAGLFAVKWLHRGTPPGGTVSPQVSGPDAPQSSASTPASNTLHVPGEVLERVEPDVSVGARRTIQGKIRVSVKLTVNPQGEVSEATLVSPGPSRYFANKALDSARGWKFKPAEIGGQPVASHWLLRFQFGQAKTDVIPSPADR